MDKVEGVLFHNWGGFVAPVGSEIIDFTRGASISLTNEFQRYLRNKEEYFSKDIFELANFQYTDFLQGEITDIEIVEEQPNYLKLLITISQKDKKWDFCLSYSGSYTILYEWDDKIR